MTEPVYWSGSSQFPFQLALATQADARPRLWDDELTRIDIPLFKCATRVFPVILVVAHMHRQLFF